MRICRVTSSRPSPASSIPALLEMTVRSFTPDSRIASISTEGMPHRPKPPDMMVMPSCSRPARASFAVSNRLLSAMSPRLPLAAGCHPAGGRAIWHGIRMAGRTGRLAKEPPMKILVLGAGVVGTTTAYYLQEAGHEVTVLDRQPAAGMETSFANAGQVSPGYSAPWAGPGVPLKAIKWMMMTHRPLVIRPLLDPFMWRWMALMLRNCTEAAYHVNKARMVRLAEYSRDCLLALRDETGLRYDDRQQGTLQLFRTQKQVDHRDGGHRRAGRGRRPLRGAGPRRLHRGRTGAGPREGQLPRRPAAARRRDGRRAPIHPAPRRPGSGAGGDVPVRRRRRAGGARRRPGDGRRGRRRAARGGPARRGVGQLLAQACWSRSASTSRSTR